MKFTFDYQTKLWGTVISSSSPFSLAGLRIHYLLLALNGVQGKLLEIGCGAGGNLQGLRRYKPYLQLYGVDIGALSISYGQAHFKKLNLLVSSAEHLPFEDNYFSAVTFFDVLEHVDVPFDCIKESVRVLNTGGVFHAYIPCEGEMLSLHGILNFFGINLKLKTAGHIQKLTRKQILTYCRQTGLEVLDTKWSCHFINQVFDISYYLFLNLTGYRLKTSLEGSVSNTSNILFIFLRIFKSCLSLLWYVESRLLWFFPGAGLHITCRKT